MGFALTTLVVIGTDCIGSCKSNYLMITATRTNRWDGSMVWIWILKVSILYSGEGLENFQWQNWNGSFLCSINHGQQMILLWRCTLTKMMFFNKIKKKGFQRSQVSIHLMVWYCISLLKVLVTFVRLYILILFRAQMFRN